MLARAKAISEMAKLREEGRGLKRQSELDSRLQRAEDARYEKLQIVTSSIALGVSSSLGCILSKPNMSAERFGANISSTKVKAQGRAYIVVIGWQDQTFLAIFHRNCRVLFSAWEMYCVQT